MTGLGQWLAGVLNRHIERHNEEAEPAERLEFPNLGVTVAEAGENFQRNMDALKQALGAVSAAEIGTIQWLPDVPAITVRPCWACGDRRGFFAEHPPCSNVMPFQWVVPGERYP